MKFWTRSSLLLVVCLIIYFVGPNPGAPNYSLKLPNISQNLEQLEAYVSANEAKHKLKSENEASIVWANDGLKQKTPIAFVYLHGFSASHYEGYPTHQNIAKVFGCNLYLARMAEHGLDSTENLKNFSADNYWESAKEAYMIGKKLGNKVILIGCSTGGTVGLMLAAQYPDIVGLINISPNIRINDPNAWVLNNPWGLQIARLAVGSDYKTSDDTREVYKKYWYDKFRLEATTQLQELLETKMNEVTFAKVNQPTLNMYYYKNETEQDQIVSVQSIIAMHHQLATDTNMKVLKAMPTVGDHVMGCDIKSKDLNAVYQAIESFCIDKLGMKKVVL